MSYYLTTLGVYFGVDAIAVLALNLQFGVGGVINFGFIMFQAIGGYIAAVAALPPQSANGGFQTYVLGLNLPFPLPWILATIAGALFAIPIGLIVLRRLRNDYQAIAMIVMSVIATTLVTNTTPLFNGAAGVALVPPPFVGDQDPGSDQYRWLYVAVTLAIGLVVLFLATRITHSPFGRSLRAMRENEDAAAALGKNLIALKMTIFIVGGAIGALSGAILVGFIGFWAPSAWLFPETIILFAALIVGGRGNNLGAVLGALLVPVAFEEVTRFIPSFGPAGLAPATEWIVIGSLILGFLWFRPIGVLPESRRVFKRTASGS